MTILYLYAELMPYQIAVFKELINTYSAKIIAVHWDKRKKLTPYTMPDLDSVTYIPQSEFADKKELLRYALSVNPDIIYCSGWMDSMYNYVAKKMKKTGVPVIAGVDSQWRGGKQWLNVLLSPFRHKRWFSHVIIAGTYQYEYVKKLGFRNSQIVTGAACSADTMLLHEYGIKNVNAPTPHTFVFIGRFAAVKGIAVLIDAFKKFKATGENDWKLICIGNGDLKYMLDDISDVEVFDFMEQEKICYMSDRLGVFVLASVFEPWGVVIHEACCLGLPLLVSEQCGANASFLINNYNGYSFNPASAEDIADKMEKIARMSEHELLKMKENSFNLSKRITPRITAASIVSVCQV